MHIYNNVVTKQIISASGNLAAASSELWLFRPFAGSPLACSPSGSFTPWLIHDLALSPLGLFASWLIRPLADSPPVPG